MDDKMINQENITDTPIRNTYISGEYDRLKALLRLQKKKVRNDIHRAMSPISAISGYLDLMKMSLHNEANEEKIEKYRSKIGEGIEELGGIIEHLHEVFDENSESEESSDIKEFIDLEIHHKAS